MPDVACKRRDSQFLAGNCCPQATCGRTWSLSDRSGAI